MSEYTEGPWSFPGNVQDELGFDCVVDAMGLVVCTVIDDGKEEAETEHNAILIAAAPELLAALKEAKRVIESSKTLKDWRFVDQTNCMAAIDTALAKAASPPLINQV